MRKKDPPTAGKGGATLTGENAEESRRPPGRREILDSVPGAVASGGQPDWGVLMPDGRVDLEPALQEFLRYGHGPWVALDALATLAGPVWAASPDDADPFSGLPPRRAVEVPWWVVQSLAAAWCRHVHGDGGRPLSIGEALGLVGRGKGGRAPLKRPRQDQRMRSLALDVAGRLARGEETKVEGAVAACASEHGVKQRTVWTAWHGYGEPAKSAASGIYPQPPCK